MTRILVAILAFLAAFSAAADITFDPPAPTSHSFVTLHIRETSLSPCDAEDPVVRLADRNIDIRWTTDICIPERVGGWVDDIELGVLDPGVYTVRLLVDGALGHTRTLVVTNADAPIRTLTPFASTRGGSRIVVFENECTGLLAGGVVRIAGVAVPSESIGCALAAIAPAHAAGVVDLEVVANDVTFTAPFALRYLDPAAPVDPGAFERVLLPVIYNGPGAFGSQWVTETTIDSEHTDAFELF